MKIGQYLRRDVLMNRVDRIEADARATKKSLQALKKRGEKRKELPIEGLLKYCNDALFLVKEVRKARCQIGNAPQD